MEPETEMTVRDATVDGNTVTKSTVRGVNAGTVFDSTVPENTVNKLSSASHQKSSELTKNDMKILCSILIQQKIAK